MRAFTFTREMWQGMSQQSLSGAAQMCLIGLSMHAGSGEVLGRAGQVAGLLYVDRLESDPAGTIAEVAGALDELEGAGLIEFRSDEYDTFVRVVDTLGVVEAGSAVASPVAEPVVEVEPVEAPEPVLDLEPEVIPALNELLQHPEAATQDTTGELEPAEPVVERTRYRYEPEFEHFWKAYPRKHGKPAGYTAWKKAIKVVDNETLVKAALDFRNDPNRTEEYTPHGATWLNQERWNDGPLPERAQKGGRPDGDSIAASMGETMSLAERWQAAAEARLERKAEYMAELDSAESKPVEFSPEELESFKQNFGRML